jgi:hypothetical protein
MVMLCYLVLLAFAQNILNTQEEEPNRSYQKIHVQTDRDVYFLGETIWVSGYLLDGKTHSPVEDDQNLYVDLIDSEGHIIKSETFLASQGFSEGSIPLTDSILTGNLVLRAYTSYLRNFGNESFLYKPLAILKTQNSSEIYNNIQSEKKEPDNKPVVHIFPEGGTLLTNSANVIGVKITDKYGTGIHTSGAVLDENNKTIAEFETIYKGLGKFNFYPNSGERYNIVLNDFPGLKIPVEEPVKAGIKIQLYDHDRDVLYVGILCNSRQFLRKKHTLACMNKGEILFIKEIYQTGDIVSVNIDKNNFGEGINRLVLLNENLNPVSERLYFNTDIAINTIGIDVQDTIFSNRRRVDLKLSPGNEYFSDSTRVSISVVKKSNLNVSGHSQNILSRLFLDSEFMGRVDSPLDYFMDEAGIPSSKKMDLLMLTYGCSSYIWNKTGVMDENEMDFPVTAGFNIQGYVTNLWTNKRVTDGEVILTVTNDSLFTWWETTDTQGRFIFKHIGICDSAEIILQARKGNESENTRIILEPVTINPPDFDPLKYKHHFSNTIIPLELYRQNYYARLREKEYEPDKHSILIKQVDVNAMALKQEEVKPSQIYSSADYSIKPSVGDFMYGSLEELLFTKAPAFFGSSGPVSLTAHSGYLTYIDGVPGTMDGLSISMVERVDIIKKNNPTGMAMLGMRGVSGAVLIYTKRGGTEEVTDKYLKGVIKQKINGFSKYREFYSPVYTTENIDTEKPDYRTTLYWNPSVEFNNGEAEVSFYTSDDIAGYKILIEGITKKGTICLGQASLDVVP